MQTCQGSSTFTLHGLWPEWANECSGTALDVNALSSIRSDLEKYWLSCPEFGSDNETFWSHEWEKHGTCSGMGQLEFFQKGLALRQQYVSKCSGGSTCTVCFDKTLTTLETCPGSEGVMV